MISDANKAVNDPASIVPLLGGSSSRKDYEEARKLVEYLLEHDPGSPLVDMLTARIDAPGKITRWNLKNLIRASKQAKTVYRCCGFLCSNTGFLSPISKTR